jgi:hypothetical protein
MSQSLVGKFLRFIKGFGKSVEVRFNWANTGAGQKAAKAGTTGNLGKHAAGRSESV